MIIGIIVLLVFTGMLIKRDQNRGRKLLVISIATSLMLNFFLNYNFFPKAMKYQAGNALVDKMKDQHMEIPDEDIMLVELHAHSFDFYRRYNHAVLEAENFPTGFDSVRNKYFLMTPFLGRYIERHGFRVEPVISQFDYNIATMRPKFLNPATRATSYDTLFLARVYRK
jgi:hypothetical protein